MIFRGPGAPAWPGAQIGDFNYYNVRLRWAATRQYIPACANCAWFLGG